MATKTSFITVIAGIICLAFVSEPALGANVIETDKLVILDAAGNIRPDHFKAIAGKVDETFQNVIQFWSANARVERFGKIGWHM
jgi:hypothetical protein